MSDTIINNNDTSKYWCSKSFTSIQSDLQTVPLVPEILLLPVVQVGHGGRGIQELQQYQEHPLRNKEK